MTHTVAEVARILEVEEDAARAFIRFMLTTSPPLARLRGERASATRVGRGPSVYEVDQNAGVVSEKDAGALDVKHCAQSPSCKTSVCTCWCKNCAAMKQESPPGATVDARTRAANDVMTAIHAEIPARVGLTAILVDARDRLLAATEGLPDAVRLAYVGDKVAEVLREIATYVVEQYTRRTGDKFNWEDEEWEPEDATYATVGFMGVDERGHLVIGEAAVIADEKRRAALREEFVRADEAGSCGRFVEEPGPACSRDFRCSWCDSTRAKLRLPLLVVVDEDEDGDAMTFTPPSGGFHETLDDGGVE